MAVITNPQAIKFCNEKVRPASDRYAQLYWYAKALIQSWNADGLSSAIPNNADTVNDGGDVDGRGVITGAMVNGLITNLTALVADLEASSNLKLNGLTKLAVNELP